MTAPRAWRDASSRPESQPSPAAPARARRSDTSRPSGGPGAPSASRTSRGRCLRAVAVSLVACAALLTALLTGGNALAQTENADGSTTIWEATLTVEEAPEFAPGGLGFHFLLAESDANAGALTSTSFSYDNTTFRFSYIGTKIGDRCGAGKSGFNITSLLGGGWQNAEDSWALLLQVGTAAPYTLDFADASLSTIEVNWCGVTHTDLGWSDGSVVAVKITRSNEPSAPRNLRATADGQTRVYLSWNPPSKTGGSAITGYRIEVSRDGGTTWTDLVADTRSTATTYSQTGLTAGTTYRYRVSAVNAIGTGDASHTAAASTDLAPGGTFASGSDTEFWSATMTVGSFTNILGYTGAGTGSLDDASFRYKGTDYTINVIFLSNIDDHLYFELTGAGNPNFERELGDNWTLHVDGEPFAFSNRGVVTARSINIQTTSLSWSVGDPIPLRLTTTEPGAPRRLMAASGAESVALHWSTPSSTGASPITGYQYRQKAGGGSWGEWTVIANSAGKTGYVVAGLSADTEYTFQLRAVNASGAGLYSNTATVTTDPSPAPVVVDVSVASRPHHGSTYRLGETFEGRLRFDRAVEVAGQSVLMGLRVTDCDPDEDDWRGARYAGGSGTDTLVFRYGIEARDCDGDGISIRPSGIDSEGKRFGLVGTSAIRDALSGAAADLAYAGKSNLSGHKADGRLAVEPVVESVAVVSKPLAGGTYRRGETVAIEVRFDREVAVGGTPIMGLNVGTGDSTYRHAGYAGGSGTRMLRFRYTVAAGDVDGDGLSIRESNRAGTYGLVGTGSTITDLETGGVASRAYAGQPNLSGHKLDGSLAQARVTLEASPGEVDDGGTFTLTVAITQAPDEALRIALEVSDPEGVLDPATVPGTVVIGARAETRSYTVGTLDGGTVDAEATFALAGVSDRYESGAPAAVTVLDDDAPSGAPSGVAMTPGDGTLAVRWGAVPGSDFYEVQWRAQGQGGADWRTKTTAPAEDGAPGTSAVLDGLDNGTVYAVRVRGVNAYKETEVAGGWSEVASAAPFEDPVAPSAPRGVTALAGEGEVTLRWQAPASDGGSAVTGYQVRWKDVRPGTVPFGAWRGAGSSTHYTASGLDGALEYLFEVRAVNATGAGAPSEAVAARPLTRASGAPSAPTGLEVRNEVSSAAKLAWQAPATWGGSTPWGYRVEVCTSAACAEADWTVVEANTGSTGRAYVDGGLAPGAIRDRRYRVSAVNTAHGAGNPSRAASLPPTAVKLWDVSAGLDDQSIEVVFEVVNPDGKALYVLVHRAGDAQAERAVKSVALTRAADRWSRVKVLIEGLTPKTWYRVTVDFVETFDSARAQSDSGRTRHPGERGRWRTRTVSRRSRWTRTATTSRTRTRRCSAWGWGRRGATGCG